LNPRKPKYQEVLDSLTADIVSGRFKPGQKLPSEAGLVNKFGTSRITVGRAVRELQLRGLVDRVAGSGTYVRARAAEDRGTLLFGLLIPDLGETEIFEPICQGIANAPEARDHALLWGHTDRNCATKEEQNWRLCQQYIARKVSGVFFAPLEYEAEAVRTNRRILSALREAQIPVILLDRRPSRVPERHRPDLVGINNRQAGYIAAEHLIQLGCKRIGFLGSHGSESTVTERMTGFREALLAYGLPADSDSLLEIGRGEEVAGPQQKPALEGFVCLNDRIAGHLMQSFLAKHVRIPEDVRIVGIDDVPYAGLLPVPLTTVRQPTREIGGAALRAMLDRIERPNMPPRDVLLDGELVVRKSSGSV